MAMEIDPLDRLLQPGEKVLWRGRPKQGLLLRTQDLYVIPASLLWCGFAVFWEYMALTSVPKVHGTEIVAMLFPLFGVPFILIGLQMVFGRFFVDAKIRANTHYAITNERAIIHAGLFQRRTTSINLKQLTDYTVTERGDSSGTIAFGGQAASGSPFGRQQNPYNSLTGLPRSLERSFDLIKDVRTVADLIHKAQKG